MNINDLTITQRIKLLGVLSKDYGTQDNKLRKQIINTFKPEPIQETKDPEPERFEIGEEVEVIKCEHGHGFNIGERIMIVGDGYQPKYKCILGNRTWYLNPDEIKKLPKQTINKEELRKHLEAIRTLWIETPNGISTCIDKYLDTL